MPGGQDRVRGWLTGWHCHYGSWWMVQWACEGWVSLGLHIDWRRRLHVPSGETYGPYLDLHVGCCIVSVGHNPSRSSAFELKAGVGRGGRG